MDNVQLIKISIGRGTISSGGTSLWRVSGKTRWRRDTLRGGCLTNFIQTCFIILDFIVKASCNYINAIIGSGIIGIPYAIREAGLVLGLVGLCLVAWMTDYSMILMLKGAAIADTNSYQDLMAAAFGRVGFAILSVIQFMFPFIGKWLSAILNSLWRVQI